MGPDLGHPLVLLLLLGGQGLLLCFQGKLSYQKHLQAKLRTSERLSPPLAPTPKLATKGGLSSWERNIFPPCRFIEFSRAFYF